MSGAMAPWLRSMLIDKGVMSESGLTLRAHIRTHRGCGLPTLSGICDIGFDAWCDLAELTAIGEAEALLAGRRTYELYSGRSLYSRDRWTIHSRPAGGERHPVLAEHRCGEQVPAGWILRRPETTDPVPALDHDEIGF